MTMRRLDATISVIHDIVKRGEYYDSRTTDFLPSGRKENDAGGVLQTNRDCNDYNQRLEKEEHESGIREDHADLWIREDHADLCSTRSDPGVFAFRCL